MTYNPFKRRPRTTVETQEPVEAGSLWCGEANLERMIEQGRVVPMDDDPTAIPIGRWLGAGRLKDKLLGMTAGSLKLCYAPPGVGKTAGYVIPALVGSRASMVVHDPKPELFEATGAHRASLGPVHVLDLGRTDDIPFRQATWDGEPCYDRNGDPIMTGSPEGTRVYGSYNPLDPRIVPERGRERDAYVELIARCMIPDSRAGDSYFADKARDALSSLIHCVIAKVDDAGDYDGLPTHWRGMRASIPLLVDWVGEMVYRGVAEDLSPEEAIEAWIGRAVATATLHDPEPGKRYGGLAGLAQMGDKERSGILGTVDQALLPFKNAVVRERLSTTSFTPVDLRGVVRPEIEGRTKLDPGHPEHLDPRWKAYERLLSDPDNWMPVTVYVMGNQAEARAFEPIRTLLATTLAMSLRRLARWARDPNTDRLIGPLPVEFMVDEATKFRDIGAFASREDGEGGEAGASLVFQGYGQIDHQIGVDGRRRLAASADAHIVLALNENETMREVTTLVGRTMVMRKNPDGTETPEWVDLVGPRELGDPPVGTHIVIVKGWHGRPMLLGTQLFFRDEAMKARVRTRGVGPIATETAPAAARDAAVARASARLRAPKGRVANPSVKEPTAEVTEA